MSGPVIIRLQNLPLEARSIDIRRFFEGLLIPDGGVHIIGGERGDAFIAFQSDEDARQAMGRDSQPLCGSKIKLYLSSKTEMQTVIASARQAPTPQTLTTPLIPVKKTLLDNPTPNPMDLLSKYMNGGSQPASKPEINANAISQLTNTINSNILDQLKNINQIIPNLQTTAPPPPVIPKPVEQPKPNMSIDQILNILQNQLQPSTKESPTSLNSLLDSQQQQQNNEPAQLSPKNNNYNNNRNSNRYNNEDNANTGYQRNRFENGQNKFNQNDSNFNRRKYEDNNNKPDMSIPPPNNNRGWVNRNEDQQNNNKYYNNNDNNNQRFQKNTNNNNSQQNAAAPARQSMPGFDPIIRVRNFNTNCSYKDVRTFLQGIQIEHDGIKLLTDHNQQRNGSAFVKLLTITDLKKALCRNKQFYEDKNIVVTQSSEAEFNAATNFYSFGSNTNRNNNNNNNSNNQVQPQVVKPYEKKTVYMEQKPPTYTSPQDLLNETEFFLKIYGLPVKFDENELKSMFNNVKFLKIVTAAPTPITSIREGTLEQVTSIKAKKICQVETQLDLERALTRQDERVGKSKLQIYQISRQEYDREMAHAQKYGGVTLDDVNAPKKQFNGVETDTSDPAYLNKLPHADDVYAFISGVPFAAREHDVRQFFYGINLVGVLMIHEPHTNKPTGEVCCHFGSKSDCDRGLDKNEHLFRGRVVNVQPIDYSEYYQHALKYQVFKKMENQNSNGKRKVLLGEAPPGMQRTVLLQTPNGPEDAPKILDSRLLKKNDYDYPNYNSNSSHNSFEDDWQDDDSNQRRNYMQKRHNNNGYNNYDNNDNSNNKPHNLMGLNTSNYQQNKRRNYNDSYGNNNDYNNSNKRVKSYYNDNGQGSPQQNHQASTLPPLPAEFQRYRNRLILLSNISYDASREDILDLVSNYAPLEQTLKIRHDDMGKPAGDAVIAFESSDDANQAVNMLDGSRYMGANVRATLFQS